MIVDKTPLKDCLILRPKVFGDDRGFFFESFNQQVFNTHIPGNIQFVQDNHSRSGGNVLRGLHYQIQRPQGKLVRVLRGRIFDVVVDLRKTSPTFGKHFGIILSAQDKGQIWVPPGFAHGFSVLGEDAEIAYKTTDYYFPEFEKCILWNDSTLAISWPVNGVPILSSKDSAGLSFNDAPFYE